MLNYIAQYEIGTVWIEIARLFFIMSQARYLLGSFYEQVAKRIVNIRLTACGLRGDGYAKKCTDRGR